MHHSGPAVIASVTAEASAQANVATSLALQEDPRSVTSILHRMQATDLHCNRHTTHISCTAQLKSTLSESIHQMNSGFDWHQAGEAPAYLVPARRSPVSAAHFES